MESTAELSDVDEFQPVRQPGQARQPSETENSASSVIELNVEANLGESLDYGNLLNTSSVDWSRCTGLRSPDVLRLHQKELAGAKHQHEDKDDSVRVLAAQVENLREMERQNELIASQVRQTLSQVATFEKTLKQRQAESQTELDIMRIKYCNIKLKSKSVDRLTGLLCRQLMSLSAHESERS